MTVAAFFVWEDGNPDGEDRRGLTVKLAGERIALAEEGDDVLGVVFMGGAAELGQEPRPGDEEGVTPVGLIGRFRVKRGQPVGDRWVRLRQVSNSTDEWLLR